MMCQIFQYRFTKTLVAMMMAVLLAACVDDESGTGAVAEADRVASLASDVVVSGSVGDGPVTGATISVYSKSGRMIGSMTSDNTASFRHTFKVKGKEYPLVLEVNGGIDLVTGNEPDFQMLSVMMKPSNRQVNINPFSTLAVLIAESLPGGINTGNINLAKNYVTGKLGFGLDLNVISDPITTAITESNVSNLVKASEALGEMVRRTRDRMTESGTVLSGDDVVAAISADMTDGLLDGVGGAGTDARISAVANVVSGQVLVEALSNRLRVGGVVATAVIDEAIAITHSHIASSQLTGSVRITRGMLNQARVALVATKVLDSSEPVVDITRTVNSLSPDASPLEVAAVLPAAAASTLDYAVVLSPTADETQISAINEIVASDGGGGVEEVNAVPDINGSPATSVTVSNSYVFQPDASDADGDALSFSIANRPSWASFNNATGRLSGTPDNGDAGSYGNITISVSDGADTASLPAFSIRVDELVVPNAAPVISGSAAGSVVAGSSYMFQPVASDADGDALSFSVANRPAWASFNAGSGRLSGTPENGDAGVYGNIVISVNDGTESTSLSAFSIRVDELVVPNAAPVISGSATGSVVAGSGYQFQPAASDADGDALSFSIVNRPGWASFNAGSGRLSGTPENGDAGSYRNIVISVSDGTESASLAAFTITVEAANRAPTISGSPTGSVVAGSGYQFQPAALDADGDALSFSIVNRPGWVSFNAGSGRLSGTPDNGDAGSYNNIVISVSDGAESASLAAFSITVEAANRAPTISGAPTGSVVAGSDYMFQPAASDADGDILSFSIVNRPGWASFDDTTGRLSGTPMNADEGTYSNIVISVTDGEATSSMGGFDIQVTVPQNQTGSFSLNWTAPSTRADGTPLSLADINGFRVHYGETAGSYAESVDIPDGAATSTTVSDIASGDYYVVMTTYDIDGRESEYSSAVLKTAQ